MEIIAQKINGVFVLKTEPVKDERGSFTRLYCANEMLKNDIKINWVQQNISYNRNVGTIRGLHARVNPFGEFKLIKCIEGSAYDVLVDFRKNSPTYGNWLGFEITAKNNISLLVPPGVAHGFQTLENDTRLMYLHSEAYDKNLEVGFYFKDETLNIQWPHEPVNVSPRDQNLQAFGKEKY